MGRARVRVSAAWLVELLKQGRPPTWVIADRSLPADAHFVHASVDGGDLVLDLESETAIEPPVSRDQSLGVFA